MQDLAGWISEAQCCVVLAISAQLLVVKRTKISPEIHFRNFSKLN